MSKFKVGDKVSWCGAVGTVVIVNQQPNQRSYLLASFEPYQNTHHEFTLDGRRYDWHAEPSLVLIERPKRKVTKTVERWANILPDGSYYSCFSHLDDAERSAAMMWNGTIVKLTGTYEIEVEDDE